MHQSSMTAMSTFVTDHLDGRRGEQIRILDVGSMDVNGSYRTFFDAPGWSYTGLDLAPGAGVDLVVDQPYRWSSLRPASYDVVVSGQAFEHFEFPWVSMVEVARVLRPGGLVCLVVPSGGYEHRYPLDCWRYYPDGIAALARWADLEVVSATTNWEPGEDWVDDSALWKDTVLVARKRIAPPTRANRVKGEALRRIGAFQASRRQNIPPTAD
jgi:SAM-dependent methyltransferase